MKRRARLLRLLGWTMAAACSGSGEETRGPASADAETAGDSPRAEAPPACQSMSISQGTVPMKITGKVARFGFETSGTGECASSAGSIYDVPAKQWHATFEGGVLTVSGKDDHGHPVELSVRCERFDEVVAEGG
jgi:hypothetical protein